MGFVNYEKVENIIKEVENIMKGHELDVEEKKFVLGQIVLRIKKGQEKQRMSDLVSGGLSGGLLKGMMKKLHKGDEE